MPPHMELRSRALPEVEYRKGGPEEFHSLVESPAELLYGALRWEFRLSN